MNRFGALFWCAAAVLALRAALEVADGVRWFLAVLGSWR
jgi:hypothetical protein